MGLIREPKNVDFYVLDKPWSDKEREEFSTFIKQRKEQFTKARQRKEAFVGKELPKQIVEQIQTSPRSRTNS